MSPETTYRGARRADLSELSRIHVRAWHTAYAELLPAQALAGIDEAHGRLRLEPALDATPPRLFVAEAGGALLGFARVGPSRADELPSGSGEVFAINVDPSAWRRGHGRGLLDVALVGLRASGAELATLWVLRDNLRARAFYEALGWRPDGATRVEGADSGVTLHELRYSVELKEEPASESAPRAGRSLGGLGRGG